MTDDRYEDHLSDERTRARKKVLVLLTDMDRSEFELREKLKKKGFSEAACDDAIAYAKGYHYIDDARYAENYVRSLQSKRSRRRLEYDLIGKGISRELIDQAMIGISEDIQEKLIRASAEKKLRSLDRKDPSCRRKLSQYLTGRGFAAAEIIRVLDEILDDELF